jgi:hypothetical protein
VGQAVEQSTGETLAVSAIPCDNLPADAQGCSARGQSPIRAETSKVGLPESVREHLRLRLGLGRVGSRLMPLLLPTRRPPATTPLPPFPGVLLTNGSGTVSYK